MLIFEWDEAKRGANEARHGVAFEAVRGLDWARARYFPDQRRNYLEGRITGFGHIENRVFVVVFTIRKTGLRIISLRKANNRVIGRYEEACNLR